MTGRNGRFALDLSPLARHERVALGFSGGKDSLAAVWLLRAAGVLDRVTLYHLDTGDLLPEMRATVDAVRAIAPRVLPSGRPGWVDIRTDARAWRAAHGNPTDLLPHSAHEIGQAMAEGPRLVSRYTCCGANLMMPFWERVHADGNTLLIRGTKAVDMRRLPCASGQVVDGVELWLPLLEWSHEDVLAYLRREGAPLSALYDRGVVQAPECATCTAWWGEGRAAYLRRWHPALFEGYRSGMAEVMEGIGPAAETLTRELRELSRVA